MSKLLCEIVTMFMTYATSKHILADNTTYVRERIGWGVAPSQVL